MNPDVFAWTFTVRGYEVDASRTTPLPVVLSYLEQLRWAWMSEPSWGLAEGLHGGHFFVVRRQVLELVERPRFGDEVTLTGQMEKVGRSLVVVRHVLWVQGRAVGHARVTGAWLGPDRRLARLPDAARTRGREAAERARFAEVPGATADAVIPSADPRSFLVAPRIVHAARGLELEPPETVDGPSVRVVVRPSDNDVFGHVNASAWARYFDDARLALGHPGLPARCVLDYHAEALAGDALDVAVQPLGEGLVGLLASRDGVRLCAGAMDLRQLAT